MPKLIPMHSVIISRPVKPEVKNKDGSVKHKRQEVPIGKPFDFTDAEVEHLKKSGHLFRTPRKGEGEGEPDDKELMDADAADRAAAEAAEAAAAAATAKTGSAPLDAKTTRQARGNPKPTTEQSGTVPNLGNEDADEL